METQIPTGVPAALLERRPDLLGLEESIQAELYLEGVAQAQRLPTIDILGSIGLTSRTDSNFFSSSAHSWAVGGGLFSPLIDWGKNISRVEAQQARVDQAKYSYENAVLSAVSEVEDALSEIDTYKREHDRRVLQIKAATNADKLSRARYNDGVTAYIEVLDVERSLFSAELNASLAYRNYLSSLVRLYKALGGGWTE
jgi:multidrug efflux system outer membrane protein